MSSLWSAVSKVIICDKESTPSPTSERVLSNPKSRIKQEARKALIERISMLTARRNRKNIRGSMTVEAALLLPLVLFFFLHMMSLVEMLRLHGKLNFALWECGNQLAVSLAMPEEAGERFPDLAVSYLYVGNRVKAFLGKDYLKHSPVVEGSSGLNYGASSYEGERIDIGVTYQVKPKVTLFPFPYMRMANRYYGRAWTGYDVREELRYVYVTLYGEVWHKTAECSHIFITIQEADRWKMSFLRNAAGKRYSACELCKEEEAKEVVYYTPQGTCYHNTRECSSLTRYIRAIVWQEELPYKPCSRCVGKEAEK